MEFPRHTHAYYTYCHGRTYIHAYGVRNYKSNQHIHIDTQAGGKRIERMRMRLTPLSEKNTSAACSNTTSSFQFHHFPATFLQDNYMPGLLVD